MRSFIIRALICALGLWIASALHIGVGFNSTTTLIIAAVLLGVANAIVRPIFFVLTLPLTIITLGLFIFIVKFLGWVMKSKAAEAAEPDALPAPTKDQELLTEIRDLLKQQAR